jgi:hypothetical protein
MGFIAWLQRGSNKLRLDTSPYQLGEGFVPPAISEVPNVASGTSANKYGGSKLISKRADSGPYAFSVRVMGSSNGHNEALVDRLERFVQSGTEAEPVYFCWHGSNNIPVEPLYGQWNAVRRAKIVTGSVYKSASYYGAYTIRNKAIIADVNLIVNPPEGKRQRVATATGGVIEDTIGSADGTSRGVIVAEATTNVITNPIFGHATPLTSWTTGADLISEVVTDGEFVLFGSNAVRLTRKTSGSSFSFYQSYQATSANNFCLSCYVKKPDSSAVTSSDFQLRYGGTTSAPSFQPVGGGWYRAWKAFAGASASAEIVGCTPIVSGVSLYVDGWQFEEKDYPTPLAYGDMLGCVWASTAHDSATTRVAGSLKIPAAECLQPSNFTWWIAFRANTNFADHASSVYLLEETTTTANVRIGANGQTVFADGTNGAAGAVTAVTAGQIVIIHATMDSAGMKLYRNGAQDGATQSTFLPLASPTFLHVGSYSNATAQANVTILGAGTYNRALTATEIAADYTNMVQAASGLDGYGGRVDWLPYLWTKDGDDIVDQYQDATHNNWSVFGSVPGSMPVKTEMYLTSSVDYDYTTGPGGLLMSQLALDYKDTFTPSSLFSDLSGTAIADTVGGQAERLTVDVTPPDGPGKITLTRDLLRILDGKEFRILMRAFDSGTYASMLMSFTFLQATATDRIPIETAATFQHIVSPTSLQLPRMSEYHKSILSIGGTPGITFNLLRHTVSASTAFDVDWFQVITHPIMIITILGSAAEDQIIYSSARYDVINIDSSTGALGSSPEYTKVLGDIIELQPAKQNYIFSVLGVPPNYTDVSLAQQAITLTMTYTKVYVTPRWALA